MPLKRYFTKVPLRRAAVPLLWLAFFAVYALTTARDILPADAGEFQLAAAGWGIPHPPGYPLYTVLGALWVRLIPLGSVPWRLNLLSAALAATTLLLVLGAVRSWAESWGLARRHALLGGLGAALLLGGAPTFWAQATTANIRMPTLLFASAGFYLLAEYQAALRAQRATLEPTLVRLAVVIGLGVGHHPSLVFVAGGWVVYLLLLDPALLWSPRRWWRAVVVAALAWLLPQLYLPLRGSMANVPLAGDSLNTWHGFWFHVLARGFSGDMFAFASPADLALRLPLLKTLFGLQFPRWTLGGALLAWFWLLRSHWRLALALFLSWAAHTFVTITYRAPQTVEYLMPAYLPVVLAAGLGLAGLLHVAHEQRRAMSRRVLRFTSVAILLLSAWQIPRRFSDFMLLATDTSVRERVAPLLAAAPPDALILADWRWATPLWVLQQTEGLGDAVEVAYVYPVAGEEYEQVWLARAEGAGERALFVTHAYRWQGWTRAPVGGGYQLFISPLKKLPSELGYLPLEAGWKAVQLLGYRVTGDARPGGTLEVQLAWQATGPQEPPPSLTVRLLDAGGALLTNSDQFLGGDAVGGEISFTELSLPLPLETCSGNVRLMVGAYTVEEGVFKNLGEVTLPDIPMSCEFPTLPTEHPWPGLLMWTGPFLRGVDYDMRDETATAYLHFCGPGQGWQVSNGETAVAIGRLWPGQCRTVSLPVSTAGRPQLTFTRLDGNPAQLLALPLPAPRAGARYVPFGDEIVLVSAETVERGGYSVVDLRWQSVRPLVDDYAVSVRLQAATGAVLGIHDMQPGLGALPTLKWVVRGAGFLDPHPCTPPAETPTQVTVVVYERFRGSRLGAETFPMR